MREQIKKGHSGKAFDLFKKGLKESSAEDPSQLSQPQVADQLLKSLDASQKLRKSMETMVESKKKVRCILRSCWDDDQDADIK